MLIKAPMRRAFTLIEMLVSLGVLILALGMVATVFKATTDTASVSRAIADVEAVLRGFERELRADLEGVNPARSILVLRGRTQAASLTQELRDGNVYWRQFVGDPDDVGNYDPETSTAAANPAINGYSDPRADLMMFFTERALASTSPEVRPIGLNDQTRVQLKLQRGGTISPAQIVYGHAAVARVNSNNPGALSSIAPRHIATSNPTQQLSNVPITEWVLARRQALLIEPTLTSFDPTRGFDTNFMRRLIVNVNTDNDRVAADAVPFAFDAFIEMFNPGENRWLGAVGVVNPWEDLARYSPYQFANRQSGFEQIPALPADVKLSDTQPLEWINGTLFANQSATNLHFATVLQNPPAEFQENLALQSLPGCAWFEVEFLMPEDPRNSRLARLGFQQQETPRWVSVTPGFTYVFVPDSAENRELVSNQIRGAIDPFPFAPARNSRLETFARVIPPDLGGVAFPPAVENELNTPDNRIVRMWPYAIRVTVRVFDRNADLERPITRRIVHWFER